MRGRELGLSGQDLMLYQVGEVVQVGVMIEKATSKWIEDASRDIGESPEIPLSLKGKVRLAQGLAARLPHYSNDERAWIREAFQDAFDTMQNRNRVIHDHWVSFSDGKVTRFGFFAARDGLPSVEVEAGVGPGEYTHEEWEGLRNHLWHCVWRLWYLPYVRRMPPDFDYVFDGTDEFYTYVRGEFYIGRDYLVPWAWSKFTQAEVDKFQAEANAAQTTEP